MQDNGVGIPIDQQNDVYTLLRQFGNHPACGAGLGLALVKQHIEQLQIGIKGALDYEFVAGYLDQLFNEDILPSVLHDHDQQ